MSVHNRVRRTRALRRVAMATVALAAVIAHNAWAAGDASMRKPRLIEAGIARAGGPASGRILGGLTAQGEPVVLAVSRNGKLLAPVADLDMRCTSGDEFITPDGWAPIRIGANGSVHVTSLIPADSSSGVVLTGTHSLTGKLNRKRGTFAGVWELHLTFTSSNATDQCDSGRVPFSARL